MTYKKTNWTEEEITFLERQAEIWPVEAIAEQLNRSIQAVERKAFDMGISLYPNLDNWSMNTLSDLLGIGRWECRKWLVNGELKAIKKSDNKKTSCYRISRKDFKAFYSKYSKVKPCLQKINPEILDWILAG